MGTKFRDYVKQVEAGLTLQEREQLEQFRDHYGIANQLIELRKEEGLSQSALAAKSGIAQSEVSRIERGALNPTVNTLSSLARSLGAHIELVKDGKRRPKPARG